MITPVVVRVVEDRRDGDIVVYLEEPVRDGQPADLCCRGDEAVFAQLAVLDPPVTAVRAAGELLYQSLAAHPEIGPELARIDTAGRSERRPLYLDLRVGEQLESLPWEVLHAPGPGFLGLDDRCSVSRRVDADETLPSAGVLEPPLRMAAVLSCLDVSARDEWQELKEVIDAATLPVEVLLFVGEGDLRDELVAAPPPWVHLEGIPAGGSELAAAFRRHSNAGFVPQVLHFFCHGSLEVGPHLEIATTADWDRRHLRQSSLTLEPEEVLRLTEPTQRPWLVVLNCCRSGAPAAGTADGAPTHSMARQLVRKGGYPAVIGMREPIDSADATAFSSAFYRKLFEVLARLPPATAVAPDWPRLLVTARRALAQRRGMTTSAAAARWQQWSFPVLYVRHVPRSEFTVTRTAAPLVHNEPLIALLHETLAGLGPGALATYRAALEATLEATLARHGRAV